MALQQCTVEYMQEVTMAPTSKEAVALTAFAKYLFRQRWRDELHDAWLITQQAIKDDKVRQEPHVYLLGVLKKRGITNWQMVRRRRALMQLWAPKGIYFGRSNTPEEETLLREQCCLAQELVNSLPVLQREVLMRFYLEGDAKDQIIEDLHLTENQFRNIKHRTKKLATNKLKKLSRLNGLNRVC